MTAMRNLKLHLRFLNTRLNGVFRFAAEWLAAEQLSVLAAAAMY